MPTIIIADDHDIVRRGLQSLLLAESDLTVIGEASDGLATSELVERLHPDILIVDIVMPLLDGLEVTRRTIQYSPQTRVIVLSMHDDESYVLEALRAGAKGYVLKGSTSQELVKAVREVLTDRYYLSAPLSQHAIQSYVERAKDAQLDSYEMLTPREREVLKMTVEGRSSNEIASLLHISPRTVEVHRSNTLRKLNLRTHTDLILFAVRRGIISPDSSSQRDTN